MHGAVRRPHTVDGIAFCGTASERTNVVKRSPGSAKDCFEKAFWIVGDVLVELCRCRSGIVIWASQNPVVRAVAVVVGNSFVPGLGWVGIDCIRREQTAIANTVFVQSRSLDIGNLNGHTKLGNDLLIQHLDAGQRIGNYLSCCFVLNGPPSVAAYSIKNEVVLTFGNIQGIDDFHIHRTIATQVLGIGHVAVCKHRGQNFALTRGIQTKDSAAVANAFHPGNGRLETVEGIDHRSSSFALDFVRNAHVALNIVSARQERTSLSISSS